MAAVSPTDTVHFMLFGFYGRMLRFSLERQDAQALDYWRRLYEDLLRSRAKAEQPQPRL